MEIRFYNFQKKKNSTAQPPDSGYTSANIVFKKPTSINSPLIIYDNGGDFPYFNYASMLFGEVRYYYFIEDLIILQNNLFELHLKIDSLATAKSYINNTSAFVKYSSSNYNEYLKDDRILPTVDFELLRTTNTFSDLVAYGNSSTYCWILTTFSTSNGLCSYLINTTTLEYLTAKLVQDGTSIWGNIKELFGDAKSSILSLNYCPFSLSALQMNNCVADSMSRIYLGDFDTLQDGYRFTSYCYTFSDLISLPSGLNKDFRICEPYSTAKLYLPLIGCVDIALNEFREYASIGFKYVVNLSNGNISVTLRNNGNRSILGTYSGNCSLSMPIAFNQYVNSFNAVVGLASVVAGVASGGALTVAGIAGGVASMASSFKKSTTTIGAFGGTFSANMENVAILTVFKQGVSDEPDNMTTIYGRPCGKVLSIGSLTGYVECIDFHLSSYFDASVNEEVETLMNKGVYLE